MAGYGPPPSENKRRRNADRYEGLEVEVDAEVTADSPALPGRWPAAVVRWYATWCSAPQAQTFTATDWQRLHMLAPLVAKYFRTADKAVMAEIRLNESLLGATHVDRLRARIKVDDRRPASAAAVSGSESQDEVAERRRKRMSDAS